MQVSTKKKFGRFPKSDFFLSAEGHYPYVSTPARGWYGGTLKKHLPRTIAEFERELIRDRVRSGIASARTKGKRIGRPVVEVDRLKVAAMRAAGDSWNKIRLELGIGKGTAQRALST